MHQQLKMFFIKQLINLATRVLDKLLGDVQPSYPQTRLTQRLFDKLTVAYVMEAYARRFNDNNFKRLLSVAEKMLLFIGEEDRYYRAWLGLLFLAVPECTQQEYSIFSLDDFITQSWRQSEVRVQIPPGLFQAGKVDFFSIYLSDHLHNLLH